jgi:N-acetylglucosaminyl-diphospho-decaprenol L-rhamnosyltransferase
VGFVEGELTTVIVTHNSAAVLPDCLDSLKRSSSGSVIVVDNASTDRSVAIARAAGAEVHELDRNTGFAKAANQGARAARSSFLCFLNPDCRVDDPLLEAAANVLRQRGRCIALPRFLHDDGSVVPGCQPGYTRKKLLADVIENNFGWPRVIRLLKRMPGYDARGWQWPLCACAFIQKELFLEVGGFDERYFLYMEDVELGSSICQAGGVITGLDATVHHHAQTGSAVSLEHRVKLLNTARLQYARRHYGAGFEWLLRRLVPEHRRMAEGEAH